MIVEKYALCRWTVHEIGEKKAYCAEPTVDGMYCKTHEARTPIWPGGEDAS